MAVIQYWAERLRDRDPISTPQLRTVNTVKHHEGRGEDTWPKAVAKQAMYLDYLAWFERVYLPPFQQTPFYQDQPVLLPAPARELDFFVTMSPFIHVVHRDKQTRSYLVREQRQHNGRWLEARVRKNFVRLCEWKEHVAVFELQTGMLIDGGLFAGANFEAIETVAEGTRVVIDRIADNRERMAIGKPEDA